MIPHNAPPESVLVFEAFIILLALLFLFATYVLALYAWRTWLEHKERSEHDEQGMEVSE